MLPPSLQTIENGAFSSNPLELLYCEERVDTMDRVIDEHYEGAVIGCYGYSVDYFLFGTVYIKQFQFYVMYSIIGLYLIVGGTMVLGNKSSYSFSFHVASAIASIDIMSNMMYFLFSYYLSKALFWTSFAFAIGVPLVVFIPAVVIQYRLVPHFIYEYYFGRIISRRFKVNILWVWLSHERGAPLINNKRQAFTFSNHDSIPKVIVYVTSWFILLSLQMVSLLPFAMWSLLVSPYYVVVAAFGSFLYFTGLLAHGNIWNYWVWFFTGNNKLYSKVVSHDTRILNESMYLQLVGVSIPLFVVKYLNMEVVTIYNQMDSYPTRLWCGYISVFVSAVIVLLGLYRYVYLTLRYKTHVKDVPFAIMFGSKKRQSVVGLQLSSEDIRYNVHAEGQYKKHWHEKIIHSKLQHTMVAMMNLVSRVFIKDHDFSAQIETLLQKRARYVESILSTLNTNLHTENGGKRDLQSLAHHAFHLITQDSIDLELYRLLKEVNINQPSDLLHVKNHTINRILSLIRDKSTCELISSYLNLLSYFNPRRTSLIVFKQPHSAVAPSNKSGDIESNNAGNDEASYYRTVSVVDSISVHPEATESVMSNATYTESTVTTYPTIEK